MASRGRGANRPAGRSGPRPPVIGPGAGRRCAAPVPLPGAGFVGPHPKIATVERRGCPGRPGMGGRASQARPKLRVRLSALHPPLIGETELPLLRRPLALKPPWARRRTRKAKAPAKRRATRAQQRAAGTNNTALFDIVNRERRPTVRFARAAMARAPTLVSRASVARPAT